MSHPKQPKSAATEIVVRKLQKIESTQYDPLNGVYKLDVYWQGSPQMQSIILPAIFLLSHACMPLTNQQKVYNQTTIAQDNRLQQSSRDKKMVTEAIVNMIQMQSSRWLGEMKDKKEEEGSVQSVLE